MKKLLSIVCILIVTSCASNSGEDFSIFYTEKSPNLEPRKTTKTLTNYEDMKSPWRAEAINLNTGEKVFYGMAGAGGPGEALEIRKFLKNICEKNYNNWGVKQESGIDCVISRYQDNVYYKDIENFMYMTSLKDRLYKNAVNEREIGGGKIWSDKEFNQIKKVRQEKMDNQKEIILAGLLSRCENFGWNDADDIASCVQQEAYRDLQLEKQKYQIKALEQKILASNTSQNNSLKNVKEEPLFLSFLNAYADTKNTKSMNQMKRDISALKSSSTYSGSSAEAAMKSLYRDND